MGPLPLNERTTPAQRVRELVQDPADIAHLDYLGL
jgi:hypothetical protein